MFRTDSHQKRRIEEIMYGVRRVIIEAARAGPDQPETPGPSEAETEAGKSRSAGEIRTPASPTAKRTLPA